MDEFPSDKGAFLYLFLIELYLESKHAIVPRCVTVKNLRYRELHNTFLAAFSRDFSERVPEMAKTVFQRSG